MCLIHCHYKQCYSEYLFIYVNFAQVQVYPWDKFLEVILLVLKNMYIWNFVNSCPSQSLHQFTISSITMTTLVSPYPLQQCELENVWFCQLISFLKRHLIVLIWISYILLKFELFLCFRSHLYFLFINYSNALFFPSGLLVFFLSFSCWFIVLYEMGHK